MEKVTFFWGLGIGLIIGLSVAWSAVDRQWQRDTVTLGLATHCPLDGKWAWKGDCE